MEDIDGDFDPAQYDEAMQKAFNDNYYDEPEVEKPVFTPIDEEDELVDWDPWQPGIREEAYNEDEDFNMDADYDPSAFQEPDAGLSNRKKKKLSRFARALKKSKPMFDPTEKSFEQYVEEYYELDSMLSDVGGGRFKYRTVEPNEFGLTADEMLSCNNKELNRWASLCKMVQYRSEEEEKRDRRIYRKRARDWKRKKQILTSVHGTTDPDAEGEGSATEGASHMTEASGHVTKAGDHVTGDEPTGYFSKAKKKLVRADSSKETAIKTSKKKHKHKQKNKSSKQSNLSKARLKSYGL